LRQPLLPDFDRISCPVTVVWGTRDTLAPIWMARRWTAAMPHAELITLPGFPHVPHIRDPERISQLILDRTSNA
jgi:pimeloyl-ACP methyl ester carboxylesterase